MINGSRSTNNDTESCLNGHPTDSQSQYSHDQVGQQWSSSNINGSIISKQISKQKNVNVMKQAVFIFHPEPNIPTQRRFLLRGDVVIDIDCLLYNNTESDGTGLREFRQPVSVSYKNNPRIFEVEVQRQNVAINNFEFLIYMLNTLGDKQCHHVATNLVEYQEFFRQFDEVRNQESYKQICFGDTPFSSYHRSLTEGNPQQSTWSFEDSYKKAHLILKDLIEKDSEMFRAYQIIRGENSSSLLEKFGIVENALRILFGNLSLAELSKILLSNGELVVEKDVDQEISKKKELFEQHFKNLLTQDASLSKSFVMNSMVQCKLINNIQVDLELQVERFPLSNYPSPQNNDFLMVFQLTNKQMQDLMQNQLVQELLFKKAQQTQISEDNLLMSDFSYSLMSEHFIEKFYGSMRESVNQVPQRLQRVLEKKNKIKKYHQKIEEKSSKTCGYRQLYSQSNHPIPKLN